MSFVTNHHLLPFLADWSQPVRFGLAWDTEIDVSLRGYESRGAMRQWPRPTLTFTADVNGAERYHDLRARLADALRVDHFAPENTTGRTGRVCVPWAGRESWLAEVPTSIFADSLVIEAPHHPWKAGDRLIIFGKDETTWQTFSVVVSVAAGATTVLTLNAPLNLVLTGDTAICPLFFGSVKSLPGELQHDSPALGSIELTVEGDSYEPDAWPGAGEPEPPELPVAEFGVAVDCMTVAFDGGASVAAIGTIILGYEWDFGDGDKGEGETPSHVYLQPGSYSVTLTIRDNLGRRAQKSHLVTPIDCEAIAVGPDVPAPGNPPPADPDGEPPDPPAPPPGPPADPPPLTPPTPPIPPEDYPKPPWPDLPTSSGEPIAPPGFGL